MNIAQCEFDEPTTTNRHFDAIDLPSKLSS